MTETNPDRTADVTFHFIGPVNGEQSQGPLTTNAANLIEGQSKLEYEHGWPCWIEWHGEAV